MNGKLHALARPSVLPNLNNGLQSRLNHIRTEITSNVLSQFLPRSKHTPPRLLKSNNLMSLEK